MPDPFFIDPDIRRAQSLPSEVYYDPQWYELVCERVLRRTWHMYPVHLEALGGGETQPWNWLAGSLDEPLLLTHDHQALHVLSNVCTHRAAIVVERAASLKTLRCGYHGRCFALDGRFISAPAFDGAEDFPRPCDDLARIPWARWERFIFASLLPEHSFDALVQPIRERLGYLPFDRLELATEYCRDYHVSANWALYCDNYLEGLHIPFVHPHLNQVLEYDTYQTHRLPLGVLQIGFTSDQQPSLSPPPGHPDHGRHVAGYYYWLFPTTMINVYPWGLSINLLLPLGPERTRVVYLSYVWDRETLDAGAGADLDTVEHEDDRMVESVARGVRASGYRRGRYSPTRERGVHHFHRLLARFLGGSGSNEAPGLPGRNSGE